MKRLMLGLALLRKSFTVALEMQKSWFTRVWVLGLLLVCLHPAFCASGKKKGKSDSNDIEAIADKEIETAAPPVKVEIPLPEANHEFFVSGMSADVLYSSGSTHWTAGLGYQITLLANQIQIGVLGTIDYLTVSQERTSTVASALGGLTFNFPEGQDLRQSFFLSVFAGAKGGNGASQGSLQFEMLALIGKRFKLNMFLSYRPQIGLQFYGTDVVFQANVLSLSLLL